MRFLALILSAIFIAGCGGRPPSGESAAVAAPPPPPPSPCSNLQAPDAPEFRDVADILERSGEIPRFAATLTRARADIDALLAARGAQATQLSSPVLAPLFSDAETRKRASCAFAMQAGDKAMLDAWRAWVADPDMMRIHRALMDDAPEAQGTPMASMPAPARIALLGRLWTATAGFNPQSARSVVAISAKNNAADAIDPAGGNAAIVPQLADEMQQLGVELRLAPRLAAFDDATIERFLAFAESPAGLVFYRAIRASYAERMGPWYERLWSGLRERVSPALNVKDGGAVAAAIAEARKVLDAPGDEMALQRPRGLFENLRAQGEADPEFLVLRARLQQMIASVRSLASSGHFPDQPGTLRSPAWTMKPMEMDEIALPESDLAAALARDPSNAEAKLYLGRIRFLQYKDGEAAALYAQARAARPDDAYVALYEADLAYAGGRYAQAEAGYREAIDKAGARDRPRYEALQRLAFALERQGKGGEFVAIARKQVDASPSLAPLRIELADAMLDQGAKPAAVEAVLRDLAPDVAPERVEAVRARIALQKFAANRSLSLDRLSAAPNAFGASELGRALCRAKDRSPMRAAVAGFREPDAVVDAMLACGVMEQRAEVVADALTLAKDPNRPLNPLWQDRPLCVALLRRDAAIMAQLVRAGADPDAPCNRGDSVRAQLSANPPPPEASPAFLSAARAVIASARGGAGTPAR